MARAISANGCRFSGVAQRAYHGQMRTGNYAGPLATDLAVLRALGDALEGTGKPLVGTSGTLAVAGRGRPGTEEDAGNPAAAPTARTSCSAWRSAECGRR